jgi:hypothetical protein
MFHRGDQAVLLVAALIKTNHSTKAKQVKIINGQMATTTK